MLRIIKRVLIKYSILLILPLSGFAQTSVDQFVGTWHVDVTKSVELIEGDAKLRFDSLQDYMKTRARASMADRVFKFNEMEEVYVRWSKGAEKISTKGNWEIETETSRLAITAEGKTIVYEFTFLAPETLLLKNTSSRGIFTTLYLTKK